MRGSKGIRYGLLLSGWAAWAPACGDDLSLGPSSPPVPDAGRPDAGSQDAGDTRDAAPQHPTGDRDASNDASEPHETDGCVSSIDDPDHCGGCDIKCNPGAGCVGTQCRQPPKQLAQSVDCGAIHLAVDDTNVYWTEHDSAAVNAMQVGGGPLLDLARQQIGASQIATNAVGVYWVVRGNYEGQTSWVRKLALPLAPSTPRNLVTLSNSYGPIMGLTVHDGLLYYGYLHRVNQVTLSDAPSLSDVTLARMYPGRGLISGLIAEDDRVIWQDSDGMLTSHDMTPVSSDTHDYSGLVDIAQIDNALPDEFASDGTWYYWLRDNTVLRTLLDGSLSEPEVVLSYPGPALTSIVLDSNHLYFASKDGRILRHSREPDATQTPGVYPVMADDQLAVQSLKAHGGRLFWATGDCAIRAVPIE